MRAAEGAALQKVFSARLDAIERLTRAADACPARKPDAVREKLRAAIAQLSDLGRFDEARLHQEAIMLAAKADIREELDRLYSHVAAARKLLADGGAIGRRLDFLAQEFGRETNTLCAKSNDFRADGHRPRPQGGGRAIARTGAEYRVTTMENTPPRLDADPVLAFGGGQDHPDPHAAATAGARSETVDLGDHAKTPQQRGRRHPLSFHRRRTSFIRLRDSDDLLEQAEVHGNFYGTPRKWVEERLSQGRDVLFDIDYQGARQVREKAPRDVVTIFILPPSMRELRARLERRAEDSMETIEKRLAAARDEINRWTDYDYVLVNDDIQRTFDDLAAIVRAERQRRPRIAAGMGDSSRRCWRRRVSVFKRVDSVRVN